MSVSNYEEGILRSLRRITRAIDLYSRQLVGHFGLTGPQLVCLRVIEQAGALTPSQLAKLVDLSQATVTGIVDRLEAHKLVTRERNADDRRRVTVSLTEEGRNLVKKAPSPLHDRFLGRLKQLPDAQQDQISAILEQVVEMMGAEKLDAAPLLTTGPVTASADTVRDLLAGMKEPSEQGPASRPAGDSEE